MNQISEKDVWTNSMLLDEYVNTWYRNMNNGFNNFIFTSSGFGSMSRYFLPWLGDQITISKKDWLNSGYSDMLKGNEKTLTDYAEKLPQGKLEGAYKLVDGMTATQVARKLALHQQDPVRLTADLPPLGEFLAERASRPLWSRLPSGWVVPAVSILVFAALAVLCLKLLKSAREEPGSN